MIDRILDSRDNQTNLMKIKDEIIDSFDARLLFMYLYYSNKDHLN